MLYIYNMTMYKSSQYWHKSKIKLFLNDYNEYTSALLVFDWHIMSWSNREDSNTGLWIMQLSEFIYR